MIWRMWIASAHGWRHPPAGTSSTSSLHFQVMETFQGLPGTENVAETIARAEGLDSRRIDMLGALQREQANPVKAGGLQLAKKTDA